MRCFHLVLVLGSLNAISAAEDPLMGKDPAEGEHQLKIAQENFGWGAFSDPEKLGNFFLVIIGAGALGAVLALHPFAGQMLSLEDLDQPKIIITYTVVGALVAIVVSAIPSMAFAIFGIGGLMRFRTELGAAKETGRVILATLLGLACGLHFWMVAILGTAIAWVLIWILESRQGLRMAVRGLTTQTLGPAAEAYAGVLGGLKCSIATVRKNPAKSQVSFIFRAKRTLDREAIEAQCNEKVPKELRGTIDWPED
jgi:hypothetical protein